MGSDKMERNEKALPASGTVVSGDEIRPATRSAQRMLVPERSGRIHVAAFDDRRPAANAGPVPPVLHGDRRGAVARITADDSQFPPQAADHHLHAVHAGIQRLRHRRAPPLAGP